MLKERAQRIERFRRQTEELFSHTKCFVLQIKDAKDGKEIKKKRFIIAVIFESVSAAQ